MPIYEYKCPDCGLQRVASKSMALSDSPEQCSECNQLMRRNYRAEAVTCDDKDYATPLVSDSLAIHPDQIPEHRRKFPDIKVMPDGRPVLTSVKQHRKYLDEIGFVKRPQRTRSCTEKITLNR